MTFSLSSERHVIHGLHSERLFVVRVSLVVPVVSMKWCCPPCNIRNQLKAAKEKNKAKKKRLGDTKQGWGGGLATVGYTKVCVSLAW